MLSKQDLVDFENEMRGCFERGEIKAPLHLAGGNEHELIEIFKFIKPEDWVLGTWRSHLHCLLKGVPRDEVKSAILAGKSIHLSFPSHRVLCSALVGGIAPIACGIAGAIKADKGTETVWCFLGDMAAETGIVYEAIKYAGGFDLPVQWIIEDNGQGSGADTCATWGIQQLTWAGVETHRSINYYRYDLPWPHVGIGHVVPL